MAQGSKRAVLHSQPPKGVVSAIGSGAGTSLARSQECKALCNGKSGISASTAQNML